MGQPQTKDECFQYERQHRRFFNSLYRSYNMNVQRVRGKKNKHYDAIIRWKGHTFTVEEKYREKDYGDFLVELEQDTVTHSPGWFYYSKADYILYAIDGKPPKLYSIRLPALRAFLKHRLWAYPEKISTKGWGRTRNIAVPWTVLCYQQLAKRIMSK